MTGFQHGASAASAASAEVGQYNPIEAANTLSSIDEDNFSVQANLFVDADGDIRKRTENFGAFSTVKIDQYWTTAPETGAGDAFHIKLTPQVSQSLYQGGDVLGSFLALTSDRQWNFQEQLPGPDSVTQLYDLEISDDGGSTTLNTMVVTLFFEWASP